MRVKQWRAVVLVGVLGLAAAAAGFWGWKGGRDAADSYRSAPVERGSLQASVSAAGTVTAVSQVQVGSQVSGQILEVLADFNSEVRKGQLIARLDPQSFEYRVQQAQADLEAARAAVLTAQANALAATAAASRAGLEAQQARRDLARNRDLVAQGFISPAELERSASQADALQQALQSAQAQQQVARAQTGSAAATVRQREAQLAQARVDLQRTQIRSPVDGIVIKRSIELGQTVAASLQAPELFVIARNLEDMQVEVPVDEADIGRVQPGQAASFTVDAFPGRSLEGRVKLVRKSATTTQNVVTYTVVIAFTQAGSRLLPGMTANVRIVTDQRDAVLKVPNAALRVRLPGAEEAERPAAARREGAAAGRGSGGRGEGGGARSRLHLLPAEGGEPRTVPVRLGISDGAMTEVLEGPIKEGDRVVTGVVSAAGEGRGARPAGGPRLGL
ncbi:efflux RND transporter periplasmic adaptor subunit [Aquabacterium sp. A7-Y]|uniref:efflux RND transporter periplasmic adaptor subunit n=1 Tax=Aquabacterium sp. A7-Y TaxID=1349605 RepID=UPI00223E7EEC|nr:efflux RND transporter periplasmic adaptor subunit [Aquabacterium sp. A7-Y]MCW7538258.1 efflux RND transporter periplasmic adaptor subunit [Aquabacterium sp. A7-Y]